MGAGGWTRRYMTTPMKKCEYPKLQRYIPAPSWAPLCTVGSGTEVPADSIFIGLNCCDEAIWNIAKAVFYALVQTPM